MYTHFEQGNLTEKFLERHCNGVVYELPRLAISELAERRTYVGRIIDDRIK